MILRERTIDRKVSCTVGFEHISRMDEIHFENLTDMLNAKPRRDPRANFRGWLGAGTIEELERYVKDGWPALEKLMLDMLGQVELPEQLTKPELSKRRKRRRADFGNELDIHAVYQGRCDRAWDQTHVEQLIATGNKTSHICINLSAPSGMSFDAAMWRGALALRIYETLTMLGRSVSISGYYASVRGFADGTAFMGSCKLKNYGEPLRTDKLAAMVNLGFMRRFLMELSIESHPTKRPSGGYGYPIDDYELRTYAAEQDGQHGGSVFVIGKCFSKEQAELALKKFVKQLLGEVKIEGMSAEEIMRHASW